MQSLQQSQKKSHALWVAQHELNASGLRKRARALGRKVHYGVSMTNSSALRADRLAMIEAKTLRDCRCVQSRICAWLFLLLSLMMLLRSHGSHVVKLHCTFT